MTEKYTVKVSIQAQQQMREIAYYITLRLKNPEAALHLLDTLESAIMSLGEMPQRITFTEEQPWRSEGVRKMHVANFLVYFLIDENNARVQVIAVLYEKQDQVRQLKQIDNLK